MDTLTNEEGSGFTPIGRYDNMQFRGTFDGQNHRIDNMYMEVTEDLASSPPWRSAACSPSRWGCPSAA